MLDVGGLGMNLSPGAEAAWMIAAGEAAAGGHALIEPAHLPVFGGYLFLYGTEEERVQALTTNRISRILPVADTLQMTSDLRFVRSLIQAGAPLTVESRLQPGQRVRIKSGSLMGLEGTILTRRGETRLLIAVHYLQQGVSVQIDDYMVEPI